VYADFLVCGAVASAVPPEEVHVREYLFELLLLCVVVVPVNHNLSLVAKEQAKFVVDVIN